MGSGLLERLQTCSLTIGLDDVSEQRVWTRRSLALSHNSAGRSSAVASIHAISSVVEICSRYFHAHCKDTVRGLLFRDCKAEDHTQTFSLPSLTAGARTN